MIYLMLSASDNIFIKNKVLRRADNKILKPINCDSKSICMWLAELCSYCK